MYCIAQQNGTSAGDAPGDAPTVFTLLVSSKNPDMGSEVKRIAHKILRLVVFAKADFYLELYTADILLEYCNTNSR